MTVAAVWLACAPSRDAHATVLARGPYLEHLRSDTVTIIWSTDVPAGCSVSFGRSGAPPSVVATATGTRCSVDITGLLPGTEYAYVAMADGTPLMDAALFHTADPTAPFTAVFVGDTGEAGPAEVAIRDRMTAVGPDVIVHTGDMAYPTGTEAEYDAVFFAPYEDLIRHLVFWPCLGNHDYAADAGQPWRDVFETNDYYSFDYGAAHVVVLDSNEDLAPGSVQAEFADTDLTATSATWKIVVFHHTIYSSGITHGSNLAVRADVVPIVDRHAVDAVFMGHEHNYERTWPLRAGQVTASGAGTVYVTTGGGGAELYPLGPLQPFTAYAESVAHFVRVAIDGASLHADMMDASGFVHDSFAIEKPAPASTTTVPSTTTTIPLAASCEPADCDDDDECTVDTCAADGTCGHTAIDLALVRQAVDGASTAARCDAGDAGALRRAVRPLARIDRARNADARVRRLIVRLRRVARRAARRRLSPTCAATVQRALGVAEDRATCWMRAHGGE